MSRQLSLIMVLLVTLILIFASCSGMTSTETVTYTKTETIAQNTEEVSSLDLQLGVVTFSKSIVVLLIPRSDDGFLVETDGSIDAKLWMQLGFGEEAEKSDFLIYEWNDVQLTGEDYNKFLGASIELIHNQKITTTNLYGFLDLKLTTPGGKVLMAELAEIAISENYNC